MFVSTKLVLVAETRKDLRIISDVYSKSEPHEPAEIHVSTTFQPMLHLILLCRLTLC